MSESKLDVVAGKSVITKDKHPLRLGAKFSLEHADLSLTVVTQTGEKGEFKTNERIRSFEAVLTLSYSKPDGVLVFHKNIPTSNVIEEPEFIIPATVVNGFFLRESNSNKRALINASFDNVIPPELREFMQPALESIAATASRSFSQINLEEISETKSAGFLKRKPVQYHVSFKELNELLCNQFVARSKPTLKHVLYCLGRHVSSLDPLWKKAIEHHGIPQAILPVDLRSPKWTKRFQALQKANIITADNKANWKRIDETTNGGELLDQFIRKLMETPKYGLNGLKRQLGVLTPESTKEKWTIGNVNRLLYYFYATHGIT